MLVLPAAAELATATPRSAVSGAPLATSTRPKALVREIKEEIAELRSEVPDGPRPSAYYELDDTYFSADFVDVHRQALELGGFENIADEAKDDDGSGYPQLSAEFVVDADPDADIPR